MGKPILQADLNQGRVWPKYATTMIGKDRLDNLHQCIEQILKENVEGHFIETGVWRGGACILMSGVLNAYGDFKRKVYVADSFKGIPPPDNAYPADRLLKWHTEKYLSVSLEEVKENFRKFDLLSDQIIFIEGFFKDTLPNAKIDCLSLLRLDGDMYSSTYESLTYLYPKLSSGGYVIVDDYALNNCRQAVDDYRENLRLKQKWFKSTGLVGFGKKSDFYFIPSAISDLDRKACWTITTTLVINILGLSAFYHDSAAALICDDQIVAAAQEERFTRIKHDECFPTNAVNFWLEEASLTLEKIDHVVFYEKPLLKFDRLLETYLSFAPSGFESFIKAMPQSGSNTSFTCHEKSEKVYLENGQKILPTLVTTNLMQLVHFSLAHLMKQQF